MLKTLDELKDLTSKLIDKKATSVKQALKALEMSQQEWDELKEYTMETFSLDILREAIKEQTILDEWWDDDYAIDYDYGEVLKKAPQEEAKVKSLYFVTSYGVVLRRYKYDKVRYPTYKYVEINSCKYLTSKSGYLTAEKVKPNQNIELFENDLSLKFHKVIAYHFLPNPDNLPNVAFKSDNPLDIHPANLEWVA